MELNKNKKINTISKLSNLSKKPPCPGKKLLEFFKLDFLLKNDSTISPKNAAINVKIIKYIIKIVSKIL